MATAEAPAQAADPRAGVTAKPLAILGAGEHARVVAEAAAADDWGPIEVVEADGEAALVEALARTPANERPAVVLGFGGPPDARRRAAEAMGGEASWATIVHPAAWVSPSARLEAGSVILAGAVVNAGATIGEHAIVNSRVVVEHDVRVGAFAHLAPGVTVGGGTTIGEATTVGLGAAVRDHVAIGAGATVGMGAVVVADVADGATVIGVPARPRSAS
jgi:acetyltransferase EpsM